MIKLPFCSTKNTVIEPDLKTRFEAEEVEKIVVYQSPEGQVLTVDGKVEACFCFMAVHFSDEPVRPMYLATRRNRKMPKLFIDMKKMLANVYRNYPGTPVESIMSSTPAKVTEQL